MLKIPYKMWFDVHWLGIVLSIFSMVVGLFFSLKISYLLVYELILMVVILVLFKTIKAYQGVDILINSENKWFLQKDDITHEVVIKDYWILTKVMFIWLKGQDKSVSMLLSRSIIGAEIFSKIRIKIT